MSMDSVMDSLSTHSEHSMSSTADTHPIAKTPQSPNNHSAGHAASSINPTTSGSSSGSSTAPMHINRRTPTPHSPGSRQMSSPIGVERGGGGPGPQMLGLPHPLSPPQVSTPNSMGAMAPRMAQSLPHLPPHGLGLLNSLQMMHHNPLELMAAAHHHVPPRSYNSPPPISTSDPTANECKLVDYRGQKVAAFIIAGDTMLCLPQAFELFLKHLVGGLHTVYTKLKRLDIVPLVCNVEQVRILRGLGAIQPGVNRCKLLSCKDFDVLYRDCTTARCLSVKPPESNSLLSCSSRPGRPPKRGPVGLSLPATHMSHHPQLKKHRLDNGDYPYENGHLNDISRLEKSPLLANGYNPPPTHLNHMQFMQMNHHPGAALLNPSMPPHGMPRPDGAMMKGASGMPGMDAIARSGIWENCRAAYEDIVKHLERLREERGEDRAVALDQKPRDLSSQNGSSNGHSPVLNLSKSNIDHNSADDRSDRSEVHSPVPSVRDEEENLSEENVSEIDDREEKDEDISDAEQDHPPPPPTTSMPNSAECQQALNYTTLAATAAAVAATGGPGNVPGTDPSSLSSTETLLRNIQSLLKVAADNARQQERQISYEKAELKMDVLREREVKDSLERQLSDEQKLRAIYQKRFKKEKRARIRLQQQLDMEMKRRAQLEDAIKASGAPAEALRLISENANSERRERRSASSERRAESPYAPPNRADPASGPQNPPPNEGKPWNYSNLDMMATGAFWQNYTESLAQELEIERKARQQSGERDVKSPLQDRPNYYKNSILFSSAT